ncbi:hypothetical protein ACQVBX_16040 [Dyella sp. KULCS107]|uniref:hypothetical protein n=1 Tax=Dyella sp. KULCS107 TaxID=3422216 RepID=UPI003D6F7899
MKSLSTSRFFAAFFSAVFISIYSANGAAQVLVLDQGAITASHADASASYIRQGLQYARQAEQLAQQVATVQNILVQAQSLGTNISLFDTQLKEITNTDQMIQSACPGAESGIMGDLIGSLASVLTSNQPLAKRQQMLCAQIVVFQIDEYNKTAKALNAIGTANTSTLNKLNSLIATVDTLGKTSNAEAQAAGINATVTTAMATWQAQIKADDAVIATLQKQQAILATVAMKGSNTILGNVVQATALKAAFTINN